MAEFKVSNSYTDSVTIRNAKIEEVETEMAEALKAIQTKKHERDIKYLDELNSNKGKSAAVFGLHKKVVGSKKSAQEQVAIINPETGNYVYTADEIKKVSLNYCVHLLRKKEPEGKFKEIVAYNESIHEIRMKEEVDNDISELPITTFIKTWENIKKKSASKYEFILKGGDSLKSAVLNLCEVIWRTEEIPLKWQESTLIQIPKSKGRVGDLDKMRHIHLRHYLCKFFCQLVMAHAKEPIFKKMSKFQIACKPGHQASEHLFVIKSVFAYYQTKNKALIMSSFDVKKMFDMENMYDVCKELYKCQVKGKVYRLIFHLNKNLRIKVQTSVGTSASKDTGPTIGQGNVDAGVISSVNLDNGVNDAFVDSDGELNYLELDLGPLLFMDDIFRMGDNVTSAQVANDLLEEMIGKKSLEFNLDKSAFMVMGNQKTR